MEQRKALLHRTGITMIAGPSGSMKTFFAINMAIRTGVPTMYFSADSDDRTIVKRLLSYHTGKETAEVEGWLKTQEGRDFARDVLRATDHIMWSFNPSPSIEDLYLEMEAMAEVKGAFPPLTVIDILMNVDDGSGAVSQTYWTTMQELNIFAEKTGTALVVVHHTTEAVEGKPVQPRSAVMGKASHLQALMFNIAGSALEGKMYVGVVKNRHGPSDLTGMDYFELEALPALARINQPGEMQA